MNIFDILPQHINPCHSYTNASILLYYGTDEASVIISGKRVEKNDRGFSEVKNFSKFISTTKDMIGDLTSKDIMSFIMKDK